MRSVKPCNSAPLIMFPLAGKKFPSSSDELAASIHDALATVLSLPNNSSTVAAKGDRFPHITTLKVNLDGASVIGKTPPPKPIPSGKRQPGIEVERLDVSAQPIKYEKSKLIRQTRPAARAKNNIVGAKSGKNVLVPPAGMPEFDDVTPGWIELSDDPLQPGTTKVKAGW